MVHLQINGYSLDVRAAVSDTLPMSVMRGTDVPQLWDLIQQTLCKDQQQEAIRDVLVVTSRPQHSQHDEVLNETALVASYARDFKVTNAETTVVYLAPD